MTQQKTNWLCNCNSDLGDYQRWGLRGGQRGRSPPNF